MLPQICFAAPRSCFRQKCAIISVQKISACPADGNTSDGAWRQPWSPLRRLRAPPAAHGQEEEAATVLQRCGRKSHQEASLSFDCEQLHVGPDISFCYHKLFLRRQGHWYPHLQCSWWVDCRQAHGHTLSSAGQTVKSYPATSQNLSSSVSRPPMMSGIEVCRLLMQRMFTKGWTMATPFDKRFLDGDMRGRSCSTVCCADYAWSVRGLNLALQRCAVRRYGEGGGQIRRAAHLPKGGSSCCWAAVPAALPVRCAIERAIERAMMGVVRESACGPAMCCALSLQ